MSLTLADLSMSLRGIIAAPPGREIIGADFSAIEARVLAWLAGQQDVLDVLADPKRDLYVEDAKAIGSDNRQLGKVCRLALGYGMGPIKFADTAKTYGIKLELKEARRVALLWRKNNQAIAGGWAYVKDAEGYEDGRFIDRVPGIWHKLEDACRDAVRDTGTVYSAGAFLKVAATKDCLMVQLPSGRAMRYWRPSVKTVKKKIQTVDEDGEIVETEVERRELQFFTPGKDAVSMVPESTYGGKLVENVTQAVARDLLAHAVTLLDDRYPVVIHVHDSIASEVPAGFGSVEEFCRIMSAVPSWAPGLPLAASGYRDTRFRG